MKRLYYDLPFDDWNKIIYTIRSIKYQIVLKKACPKIILVLSLGPIGPRTLRVVSYTCYRSSVVH
jgi:hypothetical protein